VSVRRRGSIRLWQTGLFLVVVVVAMLILSGSLSAGLKATLTRISETTESRNATALAQRLSGEFPLGRLGTRGVAAAVEEYRGIYGGGIWIYDTDGALIEAAYDVAPIDAILEGARIGGLEHENGYVASDLTPGGFVIAAKPLVGSDRGVYGVVVTASGVERPVAILESVRDRLWVTFWISLVVAGLLGFAFSELISRRIRAMSAAAAAIAAGDFEQRLPVSLVPDEISGLADSYNRMAATLGETFSSQRRFVADASHELRTPIAALKGMLELLEDGAKEIPEVRDDFIHTMQLEADRLARLVGDLLTLAKLDAGSLTLTMEPLYARDLVENVADVMQTLAEQAGVELRVSISDADLRISADRDRIVQVLLSFTDNALKHAPRGTAVSLTVQSRDGDVSFSVADEGPGIGPEELARVFERFYRSDTSRAGGGGTGLGLAIAKEIVEAHGSAIDVVSRPGLGTVFSFTLPAL